MKVLNDFLGRERIYHTEEIGTRYEKQARRNIAGEIRALSGR
jgi:predicted metal-dependent HD superfamily phosphohydrolase